MKIFKIRAVQTTQTSATEIFDCGEVVAAMKINSDILEPAELLNMIQYRQLVVELVEEEPEPADDSSSAQAEYESEEDSESEEEDDLQDDEESQSIQQQGGGDQNLSDEQNKGPSETLIETLGLEDAIIEALHFNQVTTVEQLQAKIDSGVDIYDWKKIGESRKAKIYAALEIWRQRAVS